MTTESPGRVEAIRMTLPKSYGTAILDSMLLPNQQFRRFYDHLTEEGYSFLPDRVTAVVHVPPSDTAEYFAVTPSMTVIAPGAKKMSRREDSHDVASISAVAQGTQLGALATRARVGHDPFKLLSFTVGEYDPDGSITWTEVARERLEEETASALAQAVGPPHFDSARQVFIETLREDEILELARSVYQTLLTDQQLNPPYRPAELRQLVDETALVEKWALMQALRYGLLNAPSLGGAAGLKTAAGSSTSCSCQGCTSSSTSIIPIPG